MGFSRNDPCACGSGKKHKHCCLIGDVKPSPPRPVTRITDLEGRRRDQVKYPIGTVALYGPSDTVTTKIAAGVVKSPTSDVILRRWMSTDVMTSPKVQQQIREFFAQHGVKSIVVSEGNMGCPHEEGPDFPRGEDCPFCPFWAGKQGSNRHD